MLQIYFVKGYLRELAEHYQVLRRDALNLINLHGLLAAESNGTISFPEITNQTYYANAFRMVATNPTANAPVPGRNPQRYQVLRTVFNNEFQPRRRSVVTGDALYVPPVVPQDISAGLLSRLSDLFARKALTNARNHLVSNITAFLKRVWEKYLTWICEENNVVLNMRISPRTLANIIVKCISLHQEHLSQYIIIRIPARIFTQVLGYFKIIAKPSRASLLTLNNSLPYYIWLLHEAETYGVTNKWAPLPIASHRIGFMPLDTRCIYLISREMIERVPESTPAHILFENQQQLFIEEFWESIFNIGHVEPRHCRFSVEGQGNLPPEDRELKLFNQSIETDGVSIVFHFRRPIRTRRGEYLPLSSKEVKYYPRNINLTNWRRGMYHLSKEPGGLTPERLQNWRTVFIDPGIRSLVTAVDTLEPLADQDHRNNHTISLSNRAYQHQSMFKWGLQRENRNRCVYTDVIMRHHPDEDVVLPIQSVYDMLMQNPATVSSADQFRQYIYTLSAAHNE
ncbi:hypothetical protein INT45_005903 [Circinella minor]|uniref:Uncharacterized protein n=1 Tax=Circinella minor TaxID=1195481 RepID=A0A8H7VH92_9FUNG|nr:hypothetical protein INT45_005903 [Circinella minor]